VIPPRPARLAASLAIACAVLSAAPHAHADPQPSAADRETARTLMNEAYARRDKKDFRGALDRFQAADALMHVPTTAIEVAITQIAMGLLLEARDTLTALLVTKPKPGEPAPFAEARTEAKGLNDDVAARIPSLRIMIRGVPDTGEPTVRVDGVDVPYKALLVPRRLNPGAHEVVARYNGHDIREQATLREREQKELLLNFEGTPPPPPPQPQPQPIVETHGSSGVSTGRTLLFVGGGVAAAGLVVGTISGILAISHKNAAEAGCTDGKCPQPTFADIDASRTAGNISTVAFIAAGVGVGVGIAGLVLGSSEDKDHASAHARVEPWIGVGSAGVRGSF
jgi:hypothetical protein